MGNHSLIHFYHHVRNLFRTSIIQQRLQLFNSINGDAFYPFSVWPEDFKWIFWKKPISDKDTSKLYSFLVGNGCSPNLISHWILTSQHWTSEKKSRKTRSTTGLSTQQSGQQIRHTFGWQLDFLRNKVDNKSATHLVLFWLTQWWMALP